MCLVRVQWIAYEYLEASGLCCSGECFCVPERVLMSVASAGHLKGMLLASKKPTSLATRSIVG